MDTFTLKSVHGYDIPVNASFSGSESFAAVILHGLYSSKDSATSTLLTEKLPESGIAAIAFDFPAHGKSTAGGDNLRVKNCLDDLMTAEAFIREKCPRAEICYFGSSFGVYILLLHLGMNKKAGARAMLRSSAPNMGELFLTELSESELSEFNDKGYYYAGFDGDRIKTTREFYDDMLKLRVEDVYAPGYSELFMIHGDRDESVPIKHALKFARDKKAAFLVMEGEEHRMMNPGTPEKVVSLAVDFFKNGI